MQKVSVSNICDLQIVEVYLYNSQDYTRVCVGIDFTRQARSLQLEVLQLTNKVIN